MAKSIKEVFEQELKHLDYDKRFAKTIHDYEREFVNASEERLTFLGSNLLGTPPFRFHQADRNAWFDEILAVDDQVLKNELHALPDMNPSHKVVTDPFNLSCVWLVHAFENVSISSRDKEQAQTDVLKVLHYRFLSSLMAHNFPYEPDREVVEATYAALNYKFSLKREGSWAALIEARCEDILDRKSIHKDTIEKFDDDEDIRRMVADIQGRIREVVKKMVRVFYQVKNSEARVKTQSSMIDLSGEMHVRDVVRQQSQYRRYIHSIVDDKPTFIRKELIHVIANAQHTMPPKRLAEALIYVSDNYGRGGDKNIEPFVDQVVVHAFDFIDTHRRELSRGLDLAEIMKRLRSLYMASRANDPDLLEIRRLGQRIVEKAIDSKNESMLASVRTGMMLYVVLRTLTRTHYQTS